MRNTQFNSMFQLSYIFLGKTKHSLTHTKKKEIECSFRNGEKKIDGYVRRGVEEIDTETKGFTNGGICFFLGDCAENVAERRCPEAHAAELQPRVP